MTGFSLSFHIIVAGCNAKAFAGAAVADNAAFYCCSLMQEPVAGKGAVVFIGYQNVNRSITIGG